MEAAERKYLAEAALEEIADGCHRFVPPTKAAGLYSGKGGLVLFYAYLARQTGKEQHLDLYSKLLDECIREANAITLSGTFVMGLPGIGWMIRHLMNMGMLDESGNELLEVIEPHLMNALEVERQRLDYEFFTGVTGMGLYLLEGPLTPFAREGIQRILEILEEGAIPEGDGIAWLRKKISSGEIYYDLGIPHGIPGIILFLCRVSATEIEPALVRRLLQGAVNWLLAQENPTGRGHFPHVSGKSFSGRLAWCYGDLGVAAALLAAGETLDSPTLRAKAMALFDKDATRDIQTAMVFRHKQYGIYDRGLCHGTSGIALFFQHLFRKTGCPDYLRATEYWTDLTLSIKRSAKGTGIAGHLFPSLDAEKRWIKNPYLLEGSAGVGLFYLSTLNEEQSGWETLFMLP
jgi:lantibiotic modifying enzyme